MVGGEQLASQAVGKGQGETVGQGEALGGFEAASRLPESAIQVLTDNDADVLEVVHGGKGGGLVADAQKVVVEFADVDGVGVAGAICVEQVLFDDVSAFLIA